MSMLDARPLRTRKALILALIGLALCLVLPELGLGSKIAPGEAMGPRMIREGVVWAITGLIVLYALIVEKKGWASLGFRRPTWRTFVYGFCGGVVLTALYLVVANFVIPAMHLKQNTGAMAALVQTPFWYRFLVVLRAAVTEEILYRAYPIERTQEISKSRILAALVSIAAFTYAHLSYWGPVQLLFVAPAAVVFAGLYLWRRDVVSNMIAHFLTDGMGLLAPH